MFRELRKAIAEQGNKPFLSRIRSRCEIRPKEAAVGRQNVAGYLAGVG